MRGCHGATYRGQITLIMGLEPWLSSLKMAENYSNMALWTNVFFACGAPKGASPMGLRLIVSWSRAQPFMWGVSTAAEGGVETVSQQLLSEVLRQANSS